MTPADAVAGPLDYVWTRLPSESSACAACGSRDLALMDVLRVRRTPTRAGVAFVSGCRGCGLLFVNPMPDADHLEAFYSADGAWAQERAARARLLAEQHARRLAKKKPRKARPVPRRRELLLRALDSHLPVFAPPPGARVLDFGCGEGKLLNTLQDLGWDTYGIEPSSDVAFLRHHRLAEAPRDGRFDLVIVHHVLEHVPNPLDILERLAAAVRDGGILYAIVPRLDTLPAHRDYRYCLNGRNHLVAFSESCLRGLLARASFEAVARIDSSEMDEALTAGQPLRLRMVARRVSHAVSLPPRPLEAARQALAAYRAAHQTPAEQVAGLVPLRMRAAWMLRAR